MKLSLYPVLFSLSLNLKYSHLTSRMLTNLKLYFANSHAIYFNQSFIQRTRSLPTSNNTNRLLSKCVARVSSSSSPLKPKPLLRKEPGPILINLSFSQTFFFQFKYLTNISNLILGLSNDFLNYSTINFLYTLLISPS
jgi:hypothetical protein